MDAIVLLLRPRANEALLSGLCFFGLLLRLRLRLWLLYWLRLRLLLLLLRIGWDKTKSSLSNSSKSSSNTLGLYHHNNSSPARMALVATKNAALGKIAASDRESFLLLCLPRSSGIQARRTLTSFRESAAFMMAPMPLRNSGATVQHPPAVLRADSDTTSPFNTLPPPSFTRSVCVCCRACSSLSPSKNSSLPLYSVIKSPLKMSRAAKIPLPPSFESQIFVLEAWTLSSKTLATLFMSLALYQGFADARAYPFCLLHAKAKDKGQRRRQGRRHNVWKSVFVCS